MNHLEDGIYEIFEKDPIKYSQYEEAIYSCLVDFTKLDTERVFVVMVVGAGRGPLVSRCISAAKRSNVEIKLFAIEKNPNAVKMLFKFNYNRLENKNKNEWNGKVSVVHTDMRFWDTEEKADLLVSELLGSFGGILYLYNSRQ